MADDITRVRARIEDLEARKARLEAGHRRLEGRKKSLLEKLFMIRRTRRGRDEAYESLKIVRQWTKDCDRALHKLRKKLAALEKRVMQKKLAALEKRGLRRG